MMQPKKVLESKYADKDRAAAAQAARVAAIDPNDKAAVAQAQAAGEMAMLADMVGGAGRLNDIDEMDPKTHADFEKYATAIAERYAAPHKSSKQFKFFVKQVRAPQNSGRSAGISCARQV
jgi:hypothetical protein